MDLWKQEIKKNECTDSYLPEIIENVPFQQLRSIKLEEEAITPEDYVMQLLFSEEMNKSGSIIDLWELSQRYNHNIIRSKPHLEDTIIEKSL